jgi:hypothetical protein
MWRPNTRRGGEARSQTDRGIAALTAKNFSRGIAALTMIKKALPAAFPLILQADRIAVQLVGVLWTIL